MLRFARSQFRFFFATSSCLGRKYPVVLIFELETYAGYPTQGVALMLIYEYPDTEEKKQNPKPYALNPSFGELPHSLGLRRTGPTKLAIDANMEERVWRSHCTPNPKS